MHSPCYPLKRPQAPKQNLWRRREYNNVRCSRGVDHGSVDSRHANNEIIQNALYISSQNGRIPSECGASVDRKCTSAFWMISCSRASNRRCRGRHLDCTGRYCTSRRRQRFVSALAAALGIARRVHSSIRPIRDAQPGLARTNLVIS